MMAAARRSSKPPSDVAARERKRVVAFLRGCAGYWHKLAQGSLTAQGIPTPESRTAAAKWMVLRDAADSVEKEEHLNVELWKEIIE